MTGISIVIAGSLDRLIDDFLAYVQNRVLLELTANFGSDIW